MVKVVSTEVRKRGFFGKIWKWLFIIFNVLMGVWVVSFWATVGQMITNTTNKWEQTGATIGATAGTGTLIVFWAADALGCLTLATRGKKILTQETIE
jgi:hypothetical protein